MWRFIAPAVDATVPQSRHAVRDLLNRRRVPVTDETLQGLLLIVSELVTNAVRHAAVLSPTLAVEIGVGTEWVRVSVEDSHPYRPAALVADHGQTGGRGLLLVCEITREAGGACDIEHTASGGKIIWAALPLTADRTRTAHQRRAGHARDEPFGSHGSAQPSVPPAASAPFPSRPSSGAYREVPGTPHTPQAARYPVDRPTEASAGRPRERLTNRPPGLSAL